MFDRLLTSEHWRGPTFEEHRSLRPKPRRSDAHPPAFGLGFRVHGFRGLGFRALGCRV